MNEADHLSSSTPDDLAARLRQQLMETLRQSGVLHAPSLQRAFLSVAREVFVPSFYEPETTSQEMAWKRVSANEMEDKAYLTAVYRNKALVTNIDERGWPTVPVLCLPLWRGCWKLSMYNRVSASSK